jgi:2-C-methyl-D-erythritol 2,4-cyclodiphosphate synthase
MRVGIGFDAHPFDVSRALILGGVRIETGPGLAGHSDADVLCHAVADAVLGAAGLGDIGEHFPDNATEWKDASSLKILKRVADLVSEGGYSVTSVDATVLIEAPKLAPHRETMCANIAGALGLAEGRVSVKATTMEGLGTVGRGEGAACMAVALVAEPADDE